MEGQREKVWKWKCLFNGCKSSRGRTHRLSNATSADRHARNNRGHNVAVIRWSSDGEILQYVIKDSQLANMTGDPPF